MSKKGRRMPSQLLKDLREVYKQESAAEAKTAGQRLCWGVRTKDPDKFVDRLGRLEQAHRAGQVKAQPKPAAEPEGPVDRGAERVLELLDQGIAADEQRRAEEDADLAADPGAAALGAAEQEELRKVLWQERQLYERVAAWERDEPPSATDAALRHVVEDFWKGQRSRGVELAVHPEPWTVIASMRHEIDSTREREEQLRKKLAALECDAAGTEQERWG
jgi:hypothetical protein